MPANDPIKSQEIIPVIMTFDRNFLIPSAAAMLSLLENADPKRRFHLYCLTNQNPEEMDTSLFTFLTQRYPSFSYTFIELPEDDFDHSPITKHLNRMTFARLSIINLFPFLDTCLYLDGDLIVLRDITGLWDDITQADDFDDYYLAAAPDLPMRNLPVQELPEMEEIHGTDNLKQYFNAGVLIMNLKKIREANLYPQFVKYKDTNLPYCDQDILNLCCVGHVKMISPFWNVFPLTFRWSDKFSRFGITKQEHRAIHNGTMYILHYAGVVKPWMQLCTTTLDHMWFKYAQMLPQTDQVKKFLNPLNLPVRHALNDPLEQFKKAENYILYGFTNYSRKLLDMLISEGYPLPLCFCDVDPYKQGLEYRGVRCISWQEIQPEITQDTQIILCSQNYWAEIWNYLRQQNFPAGQILRWDNTVKNLIPCHCTGILIGTCGQFTYRYLQRIQLAKAQCFCLRMVVLSDDLVCQTTQSLPDIPQEEHLAILHALKDVDEVVVVQKDEYPGYIAEWHRHPYDCVFVGDEPCIVSLKPEEEEILHSLDVSVIRIPV